MKVILFENVEKLGKQGDIVEVKDGYARNYLIPKGLAKKATKGATRLLEEHKKAMRKREIKAKNEAETIAAQLEKTEVVIYKKVGPEGKLYGSVTTQEIAEKLQEKEFKIDKKQIYIEEPIKTEGVYTVEVKLHPEVSAKVKVWVKEENK